MVIILQIIDSLSTISVSTLSNCVSSTHVLSIKDKILGTKKNVKILKKTLD